MNKQGNIWFNVAISIFLWITGILVIPFFVDSIDSARTSLVCSDVTISFGTKLICLSTDLLIPYLIWTLVVIVLGLMSGRSR